MAQIDIKPILICTKVIVNNGNNVFGGGIDGNSSFELLDNGDVKVKVHYFTVLKKEFNLEGIKAFKYK